MCNIMQLGKRQLLLDVLECVMIHRQARQQSQFIAQNQACCINA